jgi:ribosomal protein S18 acetylase RimI-like enzyme
MKITIRKAKPEDLDNLFQIKLDSKKEEKKVNKNMVSISKSKQHFYKYLKYDLTSKYRAVFIALDGKKPVGIIIGRIYRSLKVLGYERRASLGNLFVDKSYRKKGIAKKLIKALTKWCKKEDITSITLSVYPQNTHVHEMYSKNGFEDFCITMHKKL